MPDTARPVRYTRSVNDKPLFIPLRTAYFEAFERGEKVTEYRRLGPRWNACTVFPGRPVVLSHGYSGRRLSATVVRLTRVRAEEIGSEIYPAGTLLAAIDLADIRAYPAP